MSLELEPTTPFRRLRSGPPTDVDPDCDWTLDNGQPLCAMETIAKEDGELEIRPFPRSVARMFSSLVQDVNDELCTNINPDTKELCEVCSRQIYKLASAMRGTGDEVNAVRIMKLWWQILAGPRGLAIRFDLPEDLNEELRTLLRALNGEVKPSTKRLMNTEYPANLTTLISVVDRMSRSLTRFFDAKDTLYNFYRLQEDTESIFTWICGDMRYGQDKLDYAWWILNTWKGEIVR